MPPRPVTLAIVVFWLAMMSWLFYREVRPRLLAGEPPAFSITKADETKGSLPGGWHPDGFWSISRNGHDGTYKTEAKHKYVEKDDSFEFIATVELIKNQTDQPGGLPIQHLAMENRYTVDREGRMRKLELTSAYELGRNAEELNIRVAMNGESRDRRFAPQIRISSPGLEGVLKGADRDRPLDAVDVSWHGLVFNPLHPMARIPGLKGGESWSMPTIDPFGLAEVVAVLAAGEQSLKPFAGIVAQARGVWMLDAQVDAETTTLHLKDGERVFDYECRRIRYTSDKHVPLEVTTWVQVSDGRVLRQDVQLWNDEWVITRRP